MTTCAHPIAPGSRLTCVREAGHEHGCVYESAWVSDGHDASEAKQ